MTEFEKALELKPCPNPWCGSHEYPDGMPTAEHDIWEREHWCRVQCPSCPIRGPHAETKEGAIAAWNTRASLSTHKAAPVSDGVVERVARAIGEIVVNLNMSIAGIIEDGSPSADVDAILHDAATAALKASGLDEAIEALEPFAEAERLAREQFADKPGCVTLAILNRVAAYFIEWPHLTRARTVADKLRSAS